MPDAPLNYRLRAGVSERSQAQPDLLDYDAYGTLVAIHNASATFVSAAPTAALTKLLYSGEFYDPTIQQQYLRARWYDPATATFNRLDPFAGNARDPQSLHKYLFVHGDPVNGMDPTGEFRLAGFAIAVGIGAVLGAIAFPALGIGPWWEGALFGAGVFAYIYLAAPFAVALAFDVLDTSHQPIKPIAGQQLARDREYAVLADAAYDADGVSPVPAGWGVPANGEFRDDRHKGYFARLFKKNGANEYVMAYSGTKNWPNWKTNFHQARGAFALEYEIALDDAQEVIARLPAGAKLRFVGHSLGGGMATAAAVLYNKRATTFNSAGVHPRTVGRRGGNLNNVDQLVDAYRVQGEPLSTLQETFTARVLGVPRGNGKTYWLPRSSSKLLDRHSMREVIRGFDKM